MSETVAQKTARLRALRYARDGSPEERKAAERARLLQRAAAKQAKTEALFKHLGQEMDRLGTEGFCRKYFGF